MANNWYLVSALTGGSDGALDALDGDALNDGDRAIAIVDDKTVFYVLDADSGATEDSPFVISPDSNAGDKRWIRKKVYNPWMLVTDDEPTTINTLLNSSESVTMGSYCNIIDSRRSAILFGDDCELHGAEYCTVGGTANKIWDGYEHVCLGGYDNIITGEEYESGIFAGYKNRLRGETSVIAGGERNIIKADCAAIVGGKRARAYINYQTAFAPDYNTVVGDAQRSTLIGKATTTSATPSTSISTTFKPMGNRLWKFKIDLAAVQYAGSSGTVGDSAFWHITGGIKNTGGVKAVGTMTFSGSPSDGQTFMIGDETFTFYTDTEFKGPRAIDAANAILDVAGKINNILSDFTAVRSYYDIIITSHNTKTSDNSLTFTESASNLTMDGSGYFGGTTAGVNPTTVIVGTVQGDGVPDANNCDTGAATWSAVVTADNTNHVLKITVTGEANKSIRWLATVNLVEIGI